jgi:hypothetical protein
MSHRIGLTELLALLAAIVVLWGMFRPRGPFENGPL